MTAVVFTLPKFWIVSSLFGAVSMGSALAQLPEAPKEIGLPPAPTEIKLPGASEPKGLPAASEIKGLPEPSEPIGLPEGPELTNKYPGNQRIEIGENDPRIAVDMEELPWRAIGRMTMGGSSCTGGLIGPSLLLTAAHCVFNARTRDYFKPGELHFKLAYSEGDFTAEARGTRLIIAETYDPILNIGTMGNDWALVELDTPIGTPDRVLPLVERTPSAGTVAALGGYAADNVEKLMADPQCYILGLMFDVNGLPLLRHNCVAMQGVSGAPFLIQQNGEWFVGGIEVVGNQSFGGAAVLTEVYDAIAKLPYGAVAP